MGAPMAQNLMKKGHKLVVFDLVQPAVETAVATGAVKAETPSQVSLFIKMHRVNFKTVTSHVR